MQIVRTPQRNDGTLEFSIAGDILTINGEAFDFSVIPEGGYVEAVPSVWIVGPVKREAGEIVLTLIEPYGSPEPEPADVEA
jgi:hypothetical protein